MRLSLTSVVLLASVAYAAPSVHRTVLLTGATGRSGREAYNALKKYGFSVRALVRNATKAKSVLGCTKCDESEGIYVGDITKPETLSSAMNGTDTLMITVGPAVKCSFGFFGCKYLPGGTPKEIVWEGLKNQVDAFAQASASDISKHHVVLLSTGLTTKPDNFLDKIASGQVCFYSMNGEAHLMNAGIPFTIVKACGLSDGAAGKKKIVVGHDDNLSMMSTVSRADVGNVLAAAAAYPEVSMNLRFDLCTAVFGKPTQDIKEVFSEAMYAWDPRKSASAQEQLVV